MVYGPMRIEIGIIFLIISIIAAITKSIIASEIFEGDFDYGLD